MSGATGGRRLGSVGRAREGFRVRGKGRPEVGGCEKAGPRGALAVVWAKAVLMGVEGGAAGKRPGFRDLSDVCSFTVRVTV